MPIDKLVLLIGARPSPKHRDPPRARPVGLTTTPPGLGRAEKQESTVGPPQRQADDANDQEARGGEQHPVGAHPEDQAGVAAVPAAADVLLEEAGGVMVVVGLAEDADAAVADVEGRVHVFLPDDGEEERAGAVHDGDVGQLPVLVVGREGFDDAQEEGVVRDGAHGVVGDAGRDGAVHPGWVGQEWV